ncbi:MAG: FmdE family protein [Thermodesulfobacteriota bacterium]
MSCTIASTVIDQVVAFHGHRCPGLTIGIRAAELGLREFGPAATTLVAVVETDMCGVDAIQFLTGCTFGKGNLIHLDYGKMAFSFYDRACQRGLRAVLNQDVWGGRNGTLTRFMQKMTTGTATPKEQEAAAALRADIERTFMELDLNAMFTITAMQQPLPRPPRILASLPCAHCGEMTMESRTRRLHGDTLCIPCFEALDRRI